MLRMLINVLLLLLLLQNDFHYSINLGAAECSETQIAVKTSCKQRRQRERQRKRGRRQMFRKMCMCIVSIYLFYYICRCLFHSPCVRSRLLYVLSSATSEFRMRRVPNATGWNDFLKSAHWPHRLSHSFLFIAVSRSSVLFYWEIHLVNLVFLFRVSMCVDIVRLINS